MSWSCVLSTCFSKAVMRCCAYTEPHQGRSLAVCSSSLDVRLHGRRCKHGRHCTCPHLNEQALFVLVAEAIDELDHTLVWSCRKQRTDIGGSRPICIRWYLLR